jgi:hypothetical protein
MSMTDKERALHIGEILLARYAGKTIIYRCAPNDPNPQELSEDSFLGLSTLASLPERYSIKPEPRVIFVNVIEFAGAIDIYSHPSKDEAEATAGGCAIVIAHPIKLPEAS